MGSMSAVTEIAGDIVSPALEESAWEVLKSK
jgi:hypothetical protein